MARLNFITCLLTCSLLVARSSADVTIDIGDLGQYDGSDTPPSDLGGNTFWMSAQEEGQPFDVALSPDLQSKIQDALKSCGDANDKCVQDIQNSLQGSDLEIDGQLDRRHFGNMLSKAFKRVGKIYALSSAILLAKWRFHSGEQESWLKSGNFKIPDHLAQEAGALQDTDKVVFSGAGSLIATITPTPDATPSPTEGAPAVTPITSATGDLKPGDFLITMDEGLAHRVDEIIHRSSICKDGSDFDSGNNGKRANGLGAVICGAEAALTNAAPGGPFQEFALVGAPRFLFTAGEVANAANAVANFARDYAPLLAVGPELAEAMGNTFFILALDTLMNGLPLGEQNIARQSIVSGSVTDDPTSTTTCPGSKICEVTCEEKGVYFWACNTVCKQQEATECSTDTVTAEDSLVTVATKPWAGPAHVPAVPTDGPDPNGPDAAPKCKMDEPGDIQWDVFWGPDFKVAAKFCDEAGKDAGKPLNWTVNINGDKIDPEPNKKKRSPPLTPDTFKDYTVDLEWAPKDQYNPDSCLKKCPDAWDGITSSPCGHTGPETKAMAIDGSWDVVCGVYKWKIHVHPTPTEDPPAEPAPTDDPPADPAPTAEPTNGVAIDYMFMQNNDAQAGQWIMVGLGSLDDLAPDPCNIGQVGIMPAANDMDLDHMGFPPDFDARVAFEGRDHCRYIGDGDGKESFGKFRCDGGDLGGPLDEVKCEKHPDSENRDRKCSLAEGETDTWVPRILCKFPTT